MNQLISEQSVYTDKFVANLTLFSDSMCFVFYRNIKQIGTFVACNINKTEHMETTRNM